MARFDPERLTTLALLALEDATHQAQEGVVKRTWGMRLALTWLHGARMAKRSDCEEFWRVLVDPACAQSTEAVANVCRSGELTRLLNCIYRSAGVQRSPGMMYLGAAGQRPKQTWEYDQGDERVGDVPEL